MANLLKTERNKVWKAIQKDQPEDLFKVLSSDERIIMAQTGLWNPNKQSGVRDRALVDVLSCNIKGVPQQGALRCLAELLKRHGHLFTREEMEGLARRARRKGRNEAAEILRKAAAGNGEGMEVTGTLQFHFDELPTRPSSGDRRCDAGSDSSDTTSQASVDAETTAEVESDDGCGGGVASTGVRPDFITVASLKLTEP